MAMAGNVWDNWDNQKGTHIFGTSKIFLATGSVTIPDHVPNSICMKCIIIFGNLLLIADCTTMIYCFFRALWEKKKKEEETLLFRDLEELKELSRAKMFGRPGHGAPTQDIRKKKFTEHQMNNLTRSQSLFGLYSELNNNIPVVAPLQR